VAGHETKRPIDRAAHERRTAAERRAGENETPDVRRDVREGCRGSGQRKLSNVRDH
jgi:hypothetical protein